MKMWHYRLPDGDVDKDEASKIVQNLPIEEGNYVGFTNNQGESLQVIRADVDDYILDIPIPTSKNINIQVFLTREKTLQVFSKFLNNEEWMNCCEWKVFNPNRLVSQQPQVQQAPSSSPSNVRYCGNCGRPVEFIQQYNRWYCRSCKKYV